MGRATPFVDTVSILFLAIVLTFSFFPLTKDVTPQSMNWSVVIFGAVVILSLSYYALFARKVYKGPVTRVRRLE